MFQSIVFHVSLCVRVEIHSVKKRKKNIEVEELALVNKFCYAEDKILRANRQESKYIVKCFQTFLNMYQMFDDIEHLYLFYEYFDSISRNTSNMSNYRCCISYIKLLWNFLACSQIVITFASEKQTSFILALQIYILIFLVS